MSEPRGTSQGLGGGAKQRIDKWLWHARMVRTRSDAARLVEAGHARVNGQRVIAPAHLVRAGDVVAIGPKYAKHAHFQHAVEVGKSRVMPRWLELGEEGTSGKVISLPAREDLELSFQEQLIVELYSK